MYKYLAIQRILAAIKDEDKYEWFTYKGKKPVVLQFRGKDEEINKGDRFGVRRSANGKSIRLIRKGQPTRVFTLTQKQANDLAKKV